MKEAMRRSLVKDLDRLISILNDKGVTAGGAELEKLSTHVIEDVTFYKNYDAATLAVLIYSIFKVSACVDPEKHSMLIEKLTRVRNSLAQKKFGEYNIALSESFTIIKDCNSKIKEHIQDVMFASKLKKGSHLLEQGMSVARAASVMGVSRWDIQEYLQGSTALEAHTESSRADLRLKKAMAIFAKESNPVLFLDAGPIITLSMAGLIEVLAALKEYSGAKFYITPAVREEIISKPQEIRRFAFEALQVRRLIRSGIIEVYSGKISSTRVKSITRLANSAFSIKEGKLEVLQAGEIETIVAAKEFGPSSSGSPVVIDERTLRLLIEKSSGMKKLLETRKRKKVNVDSGIVKQFSSEVGKPTIIRSIEMAACAASYGLLNEYLPEGEENEARKTLYEAVLWDCKYHGSSVIEHEIDEMIRVLLGK
ncbi:hypothetical protein HOC01_04505 [archaeon]|jgi:hypothetical protein|nr:hypothetical protein [archaeon]MBT6698227.1 hypothetical protein [archaeon]